MKRLGLIAGVVAAGLGASAAEAKDDRACPPNAICASRPDSVVTALQEAGYKARLEKDNEGDPSIGSATSGYDFDILFYGCEAHTKCDSLQLRLTFAAYEGQTADLANQWNSRKRFLQASVRDDKKMMFAYDLATIGGVLPANFNDVLEWWAAEVSEVDKFFKDHPTGKKVSAS